jgi:HEAT repeat protein
MPLVRKPTERSPHSTPDAAAVLDGLRSPSPDERWAAARAAAHIAGTAAALAAALSSETDLRVREAIFTSLTRIGTPESIRLILPMLRSNEAALRVGALDALRSSVEAARELLPQLLRDPDTDVRILSCELARSLPSDEATRNLCTLLADEPHINVCAAAIDVLAEVGNQEALPVLAQCGQRFLDAPFLHFAIKVASDRITAQSARNRG